MERFSKRVCEQLGQYVYLYIHPTTGVPFYIGKGTGNRAFSHLKDKSGSEKSELIRELLEAKQEPTIEILKYQLTDEQALLVEQTAIDLLGIDSLKNEVRGHGSRHGGRSSIKELIATWDADQVKISDSAILINIARAWRYGMTAADLYDATRSAWVCDPGRAPRFALAVFKYVVREVYEIAAWHPAGTTLRASDPDFSKRGRPDPKRFEFVGRIADGSFRAKYVGKDVRPYFPKGAANPVRYVNC